MPETAARVALRQDEDDLGRGQQGGSSAGPEVDPMEFIFAAHVWMCSPVSCTWIKLALAHAHVYVCPGASCMISIDLVHTPLPRWHLNDLFLHTP